MCFALQRSVYTVTNLKPSPKSVLSFLAFATNADYGYCWPSYRTIAEATSMSLDTVKRSLKALVKGGYLKIQQRRGKSPLYFISIEEQLDRGANCTPPPMQIAPPTPLQIAPPNNKGTEKNNNLITPVAFKPRKDENQAEPAQGELLDRVVKKSPPPVKPKTRKPAEKRRKVDYTALERHWSASQIDEWRQAYRDTKRGLWPTQGVVDGLAEQIGYALMAGATEHWVHGKMMRAGWVTFEWFWVAKEFKRQREEFEPVQKINRPMKQMGVVEIVTDVSW